MNDRTKKKQCLNEDEFSKRLERIIERDFFPDLRKMELSLELLKAERMNDWKRSDLIRKKMRNIVNAEKERIRRSTSDRKKDGEEEEAGKSGATPSFCVVTRSRSIDANDDDDDVDVDVDSTARRKYCARGDEEEDEDDDERGMDEHRTLTQFLNSHTSEDNKSFEDVIEKINEKRREKNRKLFDLKEIKGSVGRIENVGHGRELKFTKSGALANAELGQNALFFRPNQCLALSKKEFANLGATKEPKETLAVNTRFNAKILANMNEVDEDELQIFREQRQREMNPNMNYSRIQTPSFTPGRDNFTPLMTWGALDSTPVRISNNEEGGGEEYHLANGGGGGNTNNSYRFAKEDARELAARKLEKANADKQKKKSSSLSMKKKQAPSRLGTTNTSRTPTTAGLTESGLRLLRKSTPGSDRRNNNKKSANNNVAMMMDVNRAMRQSEQRRNSSLRNRASDQQQKEVAAPASGPTVGRNANSNPDNKKRRLTEGLL